MWGTWLCVLLGNLLWDFHRTTEVLTQELWEDVTASLSPFELSWILSRKRKTIKFSQRTVTCKMSSRDKTTTVMTAVTVISYYQFTQVNDQGTAHPPRGPPDQCHHLGGRLGGWGNGADDWPKCPLMMSFHTISAVFNSSSLTWVNQKSYSQHRRINVSEIINFLNLCAYLLTYEVLRERWHGARAPWGRVSVSLGLVSSSVKWGVD